MFSFECKSWCFPEIQTASLNDDALTSVQSIQWSVGLAGCVPVIELCHFAPAREQVVVMIENNEYESGTVIF